MSVEVPGVPAVGITDVRAEVRPDQKAQAIASLQHEPGSDRVRRVVMVGDGVNDAPALAQADLGIAVGGGSDIAKETGGIVLVSGSVHGVATAIRLSRATMRTIRQNLVGASLYNVIAIPIAGGVLYPWTGHLLDPMLAAGLMAASSLTVVANSLRLRRVHV